jgi:hypothetical protein
MQRVARVRDGLTLPRKVLQDRHAQLLQVQVEAQVQEQRKK